MDSIFRKITSFLFIVLFSHVAKAQFYQGSQMTFGKNRVQYNDFYWTFYQFKNYDVYFYVGGKELAGYVGEQAQREMEAMEKVLDYRSTSRLQIIVYNKLSDLKQTNLGLAPDDPSSNIGGLTRIVGNKVLIYFDGNHIHFQQQLRAGVARVLLDQLMYGGNVRERLQAALLLNLPDWYTQGLVSHLAKGWTTEDDNKMRDLILSKKVKKLNGLIESDEVFAGQSFWKFIADTYGDVSLSNLVYMTRINRSIENGFVYVLGSSLKQLSQSWLNYYEAKYNGFENNKIALAEKPVEIRERSRYISQVKVNPSGAQVAYVANEMGRYKVKLYDLQKNRKKKIDKGGYKSITTENDKSFPLLAWHPSGKIIAIIKERKGKQWLNLYNTETKENNNSELLYFTKVLGMSYSPDGTKLVFSAVQKGQSDIYVFNIRGRNYDQVTNDIYDDMYPHFTDEGNKIVFSSNRSNDTVGVDIKRNRPQNNFDLFLLDVYNRQTVLTRITQTPEDETQPMPLDSIHIAYLSDKNGVVNRIVFEMDSTISFVDTTEHYRYFFRHYAQTNYARGIQEQDVNYRKNKTAELFLYNGKYRLYVNNTKPFDKATTYNLIPVKPGKTDIAKSDSIITDKKETESIIVNFEQTNTKDTSGVIDVNNYVFQSEFKPKKKKEEAPEQSTQQSQTNNAEPVNSPLVSQEVINNIVDASVSDSSGFKIPQQRNYDLSFGMDYFVVQLDNSLSNTTYQKYTGGAVYFDPGLNLPIKIGISDLLNDYKITASMRPSFDFNSNEYLVTLSLLKKRVDRHFVFSRQSRLFGTAEGDVIKVHTHNIKFVNSYPLSEIAAVKGTVDFRTDKTVYQSTDKIALERKDQDEYWGCLKGEYVFDNTINKSLNLLRGARLKFFAEVMRKFSKPEKMLYIVGGDFRYYQKIHRQIIWANRIAASTSLGKNKLLYYLGSQDNALIPGNNFNNSINVDPNDDYVFQTLATPMRGFTQNIRNGNSFALINSELRIPVFQYIINRPIRSDFIRNFQLVTFFDAGTAWTGKSPFGDDNGLNVETVPGNPITVTIVKQIQPVVAAYGFGIRSRLLGYFVRLDWGYGIDDRQVQPQLFNLSLGLDF